MLDFFKNILLTQKVNQPQSNTTPKKINPFLINRKIDRIHILDYYGNRFDDNQFYSLNLKTGLIFFIDKTNNNEFENYINENHTNLKESLAIKGRVFIKEINDVELPSNLDINYFFPFIDDLNLSFFRINKNKYILDFIGYKGNIETGFLSFTSSGITFFSIKENENFNEFVSQYIDDLSIDNHNKIPIFYSLRKKTEDDEPQIEIDSETKLLLNQIEDNLLKLEKSGQYFLIAPKIENLIKNLFKHDKDHDFMISEVLINYDFQIILPQYQNREIKLSHLTKSIYILFLKHPEGILLRELYKYENELLSIYKAISYQVSLDKMKKSVQHLITNEKAIFVHFSRIKSVFMKNFTNNYARYYYIQGEKGQKKLIKLPLSKIIFQSKI
ncbi:conserved hypothetical protein [Flavobacterium psychrophilum]|uniref:hypothetical protein n=1 Tax=Flavobacterium psychrophilum TaxID=96345 RepID=UPI000B7C4408|nr:hypothetical protein [Flavobacterium psychrophilum]SNB97180.1 conserved hypothetical protein [Flavobacterium psychrophilum]